MFQTLSSDLEFLKNKYHKTDEPFDGFQRMAYHGWECDPSTGLDDGELDAALAACNAQLTDTSHAIRKAKLFAFVLEHDRIDVNPHDYFIVLYNWNRPIRKYTAGVWEQEAARAHPEASKLHDRQDAAGALYGWLDFDHTVPDWEAMMALGFPGLLNRAHESYRRICSNGTPTEKQTDFYHAVVIAYEAVLHFLDRLASLAETKTFPKAGKIARCLRNLQNGAPTDSFEAMQLIYLYFMLSESVDQIQVRSLGYGLDATLWPFWQRDLAEGRYTETELQDFLGYFLLQWSAIGNYWGQPFYLGGRDAQGRTKVNALSREILRVYDALGIYNPKIQIKVHPSTPKDFLLQALDMVRRNHSSIVFCNDEVIAKSLMADGYAYEAAADSVISGCYEYKTKNGGIGISALYFNLLKPVSLVLDNGLDVLTGDKIGVETGEPSKFPNFHAFYEAYLTQLRHQILTGLGFIMELEQDVQQINPFLLYSATIADCMDTMTDALDGGVRNDTQFLLCGLGTAVDALMAVRELVYQRKTVSMETLRRALHNNWEGYESLRRQALHLAPKYGNGCDLADSYAAAIVRQVHNWTAGLRNTHGGRVGFEIHSARAFLIHGEKTIATPDGRHAGEEMSKNASPTPGMDTKGITALIRSATAIDTTLCTNGFCLDAMLHPSALQGDHGLEAFYAVLQTYMQQGGASIHFNIADTETLRDAQRQPEKYGDLQVRICGWNALWNDVPKKEQDAYIQRAEGIGK